MITINNYEEKYEDEWLRCRLLSYFYSSMYEDVVTEKPHFPDRETIELVALNDGHVVGIMDMVLDSQHIKTSFLSQGPGAFLQTIAVHPDYQGQGIARQLMAEALKRLERTDIKFIELYTRGDVPANSLYQSLGFKLQYESYDVFGNLKSQDDEITITGIENKRLKVEHADGSQCRYSISQSEFEVFTEEGLESIDIDRVYPSRGYLLYL